MRANDENPISFYIFWLVVPFIPLYLTLPYDLLFYPFLLSYIVFFVLNCRRLRYPWSDIFVFIFAFLFFTLLVKSLYDYQVFNEKELLRNSLIAAAVYG